MKNPIYQQNTATLAEVALRAGVSRQTAGRILGAGAHKHKPVTVEKVKQAAEELGYRPNLLAKGVVAGRTFSVGVLMPRINNDDFFARVITGIQDALAKTDLIPLFMLTSRSAPELEQLHRLIDRRVDGILLIPEISEVSPDYFMEISRRNIPVVCSIPDFGIFPRSIMWPPPNSTEGKPLRNICLRQDIPDSVRYASDSARKISEPGMTGSKPQYGPPEPTTVL